MNKKKVQTNSVPIKKPLVFSYETPFNRAAAWCGENQLKLIALLSSTGDWMNGINPSGGSLWKVGAGTSFVIHGCLFLFGKGGRIIDKSEVKVTKKTVRRTIKEIITLPKPLLTRSYWHDLRKAAGERTIKEQIQRAKKAAFFRKNPLDASWFGYAATGGLFFLDAVLDPSGLRWGEALMGLICVGVSGTGFVTDKPELTAPLWCTMTTATIATGLLTHNPSLCAAGGFYWLVDYLYSKSDSAYQSTARTKETLAKLDRG